MIISCIDVYEVVRRVSNDILSLQSFFHVTTFKYTPCLTMLNFEFLKYVRLSSQYSHTAFQKIILEPCVGVYFINIYHNALTFQV